MLTNSKLVSKRIIEKNSKKFLLGKGFITSPVAQGYSDGTLNNSIQKVYLREREI